jgi:Ca2+-binding EF-hand superfamily protein
MKNTTSKLVTLIGALAVLVSFSAPALRAEDMPKKKEPSKKQLEMWDKNHDGKLDDEEMAAMKAAQAAKKKGKDGAGHKADEKAPEKK